jgi:hypothetical protein
VVATPSKVSTPLLPAHSRQLANAIWPTGGCVPEGALVWQCPPFRLAKPFLFPSFQSVIRSGIECWIVFCAMFHVTESCRFSAGCDTVGDMAGAAGGSAPPLTFLIPSHFSIISPLVQTGSPTAFLSPPVRPTSPIHSHSFLQPF